MFIGQDKLISELDILIPLIKEQNININILFRAPSGYGKTMLSFIIANMISNNDFKYYLPDKDGNVFITENKRVHVIDEIHTCKNQEMLYPLLDSNKFVFIFTTNETGNVKEPLINRCVNYIFEPYNDKELSQLIDQIFSDNKPTGFDYHPYFINYSRVPRILVRLTQRLNYLFTYYGVPNNEDMFRFIFEDIINIHDGLDQEQMRYLTFLNSVPSASLDLISSAIKVDKDTIRRDIEPGLIYKNLILITSRGRKINQ